MAVNKELLQELLGDVVSTIAERVTLSWRIRFPSRITSTTATRMPIWRVNGKLSMTNNLWRFTCFQFLSLCFLTMCSTANSIGAAELGEIAPLLRKYCVECHGEHIVQGNIDVERLISAPDLAHRFNAWERVIDMLQSNRMPPKDSSQPTDDERKIIRDSIQDALANYVQRFAGDPGVSVLRRLTSAEYDYTIQDLTGLKLRLDRKFVNDGVGGEGFTNVGIAQFMQDSSLELYLEAAKLVADHTVIGAGSLRFFKDPGQTGRELSAIHRIQQIYRQNGFRTAAGEGGEPFGLDLYSRSFAVAYRFQHRQKFDSQHLSLEQMAREEGLSERFCRHIWEVLNHDSASTFPLSFVVEQWRAINPPTLNPPHQNSPVELDAPGPEVRAQCDALASVLREWQSMLAAVAGDEEEAAVLDAAPVTVIPKHSFKADVNWQLGAHTAEFEISVSSASRQSSAGALVIWKNPRLRFRQRDNRRLDDVTLKSCLTPESMDRLGFGKHPNGGTIGPNDFVILGDSTVKVLVQVPRESRAAQLFVDVELDLIRGFNRIVRCRIADGHVEGETVAEVGATSALLGDPSNEEFARWQSGVTEFARLLPEVSHREPAPSDRDPIPAPFDNTYNKPERNHFHIAVKYHRDDHFLVQNILDDATRQRLDEAWTDLLTSFEYHESILRFMASKFNCPSTGDNVEDIAASIRPKLPPDAAKIADDLVADFRSKQQRLDQAELGHVNDVVEFASRAWRRTLTESEQQSIPQYYPLLRKQTKLDHTKSIRWLLTRVLVAPEFLYHAEESADAPSSPVRIADVELEQVRDMNLANRLSYFLWSSPPDDELRRAASAGELKHAEQMISQSKRMLQHPHARRFATEFFGQWMGFYRFDAYRGIDSQRFPELSDDLKVDLYDEAVTFFEHIVREDRPVREILFADYTFLNSRLAAHYGLNKTNEFDERWTRMDGVVENHRGGILGLGAIHAITSAPLRTSAVKRGDWVLRRVIGRPVPPPPADAGSIASDDALPDGLTVRRRLEAHRSDTSCRNCHARIDPLGFALEHFDPIGRWRDTYRDGQAIDESGELHDGTEVRGWRGLKEYLEREFPAFERNLASKLLSYALGRSEMASDRPLIDAILVELGRTGKLSDAVAKVVSSRQFMYRRK